MKILVSVAVATLVMFSGCSDDKDNNNNNDPVSMTEENKKLEIELGEKLFFEKNLSLTRNTSCSTCHDPEKGLVDARFSEVGRDQNIFVNGAFSVGDDGSALGGRNAPTASYAMFSPEFHKQADGSYKGGQFHDGRAATLKVQAGGPPLDGAEMQMPDKNSVVDRVKENDDYVTAFKNLYGVDIFDDIDKSYERMTQAIANFEKTDEFAPFDSKYDRMLKGEYTFTDLEDLGYSLFFDNANTNCVLCHSLNSKSEKRPKELFTNYEYENIGTPRNISAMDARAALGLQDANATFGGLGITVKSIDTNWETHLGKTKVPTLRNIAVTAPYMNNGVFKDLRTVIEFYDHMLGKGDRPNNPETNTPWIANDNEATINYELLRTGKALTDSKVRAMEAFLRTLTDEKYEHLMPELKD